LCPDGISGIMVRYVVSIDPLCEVSTMPDVTNEPRILTTGLLGRVEDVRHGIFRLGFVFLLGAIVAYPFAGRLLHLLKQPLQGQLVMYAPLEGFMGYVKVALAAGFLLTAPLMLYEVKRLLQNLCQLPRSVAIGGTVAAGGLFLTGVTFCYLAILPVTLRFLLSYGGDNITAGISVSNYLSLTLGLSAACGVMFELPLVVLILHRLGLLSIAFLTQNRRYAILLATVVTAIVTPTPDAFTLSMLLGPMLALYEVSILLMRLSERRERGKAA
jgi:sec-independent protein translocase protein TatC